MRQSLVPTTLFWLLSGFAGAAPAAWHSDVQIKMGTHIEVQLWTEDTQQAKLLLRQAMAEFDRIEAMMSTYIASSEMSRINDLAHVQPQAVSPELFTLLQQSLELSELTGGAFDISYDSVGQLYDFRAGEHPDALQIASRLHSINYRQIRLDPEQQTIALGIAGMRINLGGIAKGYAVEKVIGLLRAAGIDHALATAGGDTRMLGDRRDKPWIVGIRDPNQTDGVFTRLALIDEAISTSGDYERFFMEDGQRYHHIIRPTDGRPVQGVRSVTVIGPDAVLTDALSTSLFVLGPEKGLALLAGLPGYEAVVITDEQLYYSEGLAAD